MILTWIIVAIMAIAALTGIIFVVGGFIEKDGLSKFGGIITLVIAVGLGGWRLWWQYGTASGEREIKSFQSETKGGVERIVTVYDVNGQEIQKYEGKFDVERRTDSILFDDENGKRHIIYFTTGTVIVDEK